MSVANAETLYRADVPVANGEPLKKKASMAEYYDNLGNLFSEYYGLLANGILHSETLLGQLHWEVGNLPPQYTSTEKTVIPLTSESINEQNDAVAPMTSKPIGEQKGMNFFGEVVRSLQ